MREQLIRSILSLMARVIQIRREGVGERTWLICFALLITVVSIGAETFFSKLRGYP
jgi:hypothetical protein